MKKFLVVAGVIVLALLVIGATVCEYSVVYLYASQPENHGQLRFKVYAWICVIAFLVEVVLALWALARALTWEPDRNVHPSPPSQS